MYYEVYIDVVFVTNLVMDFLLLRLLVHFLKRHCPWWKSFLGAAVGAAGSCLILLIPSSPQAVVILLHGILAILMVRIGGGVRSKSMVIQGVVTLYFTAFLCGGLWDVMAGERKMTLLVFFLYGGITYGVLTLGTMIQDYWKMRRRNLYKVRLNYQGKILSVKGLHDTGNQLTDLGSDRPVSITTFGLLKELLPVEMYENLRAYQEDAEVQSKGEWRNLKPHFLTFQSAGNSSAMALAITLDDMCIDRECELLYVPRPIVAVPLNEFSLPKDYQIILNGNLLEL